jgi:hypothetical protein
LVNVNGRIVDTDTISYLPAFETYRRSELQEKDYFGLDSLNQDSSSSEIRLTRLYNKCILFVILKSDNKSWKGFKASLILQHKEINDSSVLRYIPKTTIHTPPSMGWNNFVKKLVEMDLLKMGKEIPFNSGSDTDADYIKVEYLYNNEYRQYDGQRPHLGDSPGAKKMAKILKFVEKQLKFKGFYLIED